MAEVLPTEKVETKSRRRERRRRLAIVGAVSTSSCTTNSIRSKEQPEGRRGV